MPSVSLLSLACACAVAGVLVLRIAWARAHRSALLNACGWGLAALAAGFGWAFAGAWSVAVAALWGTGAAFLALAWAALSSGVGKATASNRRAKMLPEAGQPRRIGRRIVTFLIAVPLAMAVSIGLAAAARGVAGLAGWSEANANVFGLFVAPLAWAAIVHLVLIQERRRAQWTILAICALPAVPVVLTGVAG